MIVLVTGKPGVGKTTAIDAFIHATNPPEWVVTRPIMRADGLRDGFMAIRSDGKQRIISHKTDIRSDAVVGQNHVDITAVDEMFSDALTHVGKSDHVVVVDEIGPIQLLSHAFSHELQRVFTGGGNLLASIHYSDERLEIYRSHPNAFCLTLTTANRDLAPKILELLFTHSSRIESLTSPIKHRFNTMLSGYLAQSMQIQIEKLIRNAVAYVSQERVEQQAQTIWTVKGNHGNHIVRKQPESFTCDCDLFLGAGIYSDSPGTCSHIQAVQLVTLSK